MVEHFFRSLSYTMGCTLHLKTKGKTTTTGSKACSKCLAARCAGRSASRAIPCRARKECCDERGDFGYRLRQPASVTYAVRRTGYQPEVSRDPEIVLRADKLFLPGVGTAQAAMDQLRERDLIELIRACTQPVLGICLGMQLLAASSEENGGITTLGLIDTPVKQMTDFGLPLPHMGWNQVSAQAGHHLFRGIDDGAYFYFVHSYAMPICPSTIAQANYGEPFTAAVQKTTSSACSFIQNDLERPARNC